MNIRHAEVINPDCYWILKEKTTLSEQNPGQRKEKTRQDEMEISLHFKRQKEIPDTISFNESYFYKTLALSWSKFIDFREGITD